MDNVKDDNNRYRIVLMKTINDENPIFYRLLNLKTFKTVDIPAYKILDKIINDGWTIENAICRHNSLVIINEDGYESLDEIITYDEFEDNVDSIFEWSFKNKEYGTDAIQRYDSMKNSELGENNDKKIYYSPNDVEINSRMKVYWKCDKKHNIYLDFASMFSTKFKCPICEAKKNEDTHIDLTTWANITGNKTILNMYVAANNEIEPSEINYDSKKKVRLLVNVEDFSNIEDIAEEDKVIITEVLGKITSGKINNDELLRRI